jgi:glycerol transport system permease protein
VGEFDVGKAAAFSIIYFLIVLVFSYVFYQVLLRAQRGEVR